MGPPSVMSPHPMIQWSSTFHGTSSIVADGNRSFARYCQLSPNSHTRLAVALWHVIGSTTRGYLCCYPGQSIRVIAIRDTQLGGLIARDKEAKRAGGALACIEFSRFETLINLVNGVRSVAGSACNSSAGLRWPTRR